MKKKSKSQIKAAVAVVMGSDSDWEVMQKSEELLREFGVISNAQVVSAHRTPMDLSGFTKECEDSGIRIIIAGAGGAAHLPGMLASYTTLPVIGVPINITKLEGLDSLLSILQMPGGVPVATVGIDNAKNAALLALRILALNDSTIAKKLRAYSVLMAKKSRQKNKTLKEKLK